MGRKKKEELDTFSGKVHLRWDLYPVMARHKVKSAAHLGRLLQTVGVEFSSVYLSRIIYDRPTILNLTLLDALVCIFNCTPNDLLVVEPYEPPAGRTEPQEKVPAQPKPSGGKSRVKKEGPKEDTAGGEGRKKDNVTPFPVKGKTAGFVPETEEEALAMDFLNIPTFVAEPKPEGD
jgi:hypothetical protein